MTIGGWLIMLTSVSSVTGLLAWCILRVLRTPETTQRSIPRLSVGKTEEHSA